MTISRVGTLPLIDGGDLQPGGQYRFVELQQSIDLASQAAATAGNQDVAATGLAVGDLPLYVVPPAALIAGVSVVALGAVATINTIRLRVTNPTAGAVDAAAGVYAIGVLRAV